MSDQLIFGEDSWNNFYSTLKNKKQVFISVTISNTKEKIYLTSYKLWQDLKNFCETNSKYIEEVTLQFRSNKVSCHISQDTDGVYCVNSIVGWMGGGNKKNIVIGSLKDKIITKRTWTIPELTEASLSYTTEGKCFKEAIIYNVKKAKTI